MPTLAAAPPRLAGLLTGRRTKYAALLLLVGLLALAGPLAGKIGDVEENGATSMLPTNAESTLVEEELPAFATDGVRPAVVVWKRDGGLTAADPRAATSGSPTSSSPAARPPRRRLGCVQEPLGVAT